MLYMPTPVPTQVVFGGRKIAGQAIVTEAASGVELIAMWSQNGSTTYVYVCVCVRARVRAHTSTPQPQRYMIHYIHVATQPPADTVFCSLGVCPHYSSLERS